MDLEHMTREELEKLLGDALDAAKEACDEAADHTDPAVVDAVKEALDVYRKLYGR